MRLKFFIFSFIAICFVNPALSQSIKPFVFNMGGGSATIQSNSFAWSIGEAPVVGQFSNNNYLLSVGVLQPNSDVVTGIIEAGELVFGNQIVISPNPSYGDIKIHFKMERPGRASVLLFNSTSQLQKVIDVKNISQSKILNMSMGTLVSGLYFIKVKFEDNLSVKQGIYKIIKF